MRWLTVQADRRGSKAYDSTANFSWPLCEGQKNTLKQFSLPRENYHSMIDFLRTFHVTKIATKTRTDAISVILNQKESYPII